MKLFVPSWRVGCGVAVAALCAAMVFGSVAVDESQEVNIDLSAAAKIQAEPELDESPAAEVERNAHAPQLIAVTNPAPISVARLDDAAFDTAWGEDPSRLGAVAAGRPNRGFLYNGTRLLNDGVYFKLEEPENAYGTEETIAGLTAAVAEVHRLFPGTKPLSVGHISRAMGGWLKPHKSHQNGRDADLGFYYTDDSPWYRRASAENLDVARTWALITAMERAAGIEYLFVDRSLHDVLRNHAEEISEPPEFIEYMFDGPMPLRGPTIRHARGHQTHLHVRFASPIAVENSQRVAKRLGKAGRNSGQLVQLLRQQAARQTKQKVTKRARVRPRSHATAKASHAGGSANVKAL